MRGRVRRRPTSGEEPFHGAFLKQNVLFLTLGRTLWASKKKLVRLKKPRNSGVVAGRVRGSDADARHAESPSSDAVPSYFCTF